MIKKTAIICEIFPISSPVNFLHTADMKLSHLINLKFLFEYVIHLLFGCVSGQSKNIYIYMLNAKNVLEF